MRQRRPTRPRPGLRAALAALLTCSGIGLALVSLDGPVGAQVPTTLPTTAPTTAPPTTSAPTTSRPAPTTTSPSRTTAPPDAGAPDEEQSPAGSGSAPTSARPPATGGADEGEAPEVPAGRIDPAQLGDDEDPLITSAASGKLPAVFSWLSLVGTFAFVCLVALQWALTNPGRRGSRTL